MNISNFNHLILNTRLVIILIEKLLRQKIMKKKTTIEIFFFILSLITVFCFVIGIFLAFFTNNWDLGMVSFVIFLGEAAMLFFFGNIYESLEQKKNQE